MTKPLNTVTIDVSDPRFQDYDSVFDVVRDEYLDAHPELREPWWDLSPRWGDNNRETVVLIVPDGYR